MNDEILKELLQEILTENKEIKNEQQFLKTAFENFASQENEALEHLKNLKLNVDLSKMKDFFQEKIDKINLQLLQRTDNLSSERKEIIHTLSRWKGALISFIKLLIVGATITFVVLLFGKYYMPVIKENNKYRNAFEYVYYENTKAQDYLQELILDFDNKKFKKQRIKETNERKSKSSNPLVFER